MSKCLKKKIKRGNGKEIFTDQEKKRKVSFLMIELFAD
jgi:hypothetical protein